MAFTPASQMINGSLRWGLSGATPPNERDARNRDNMLFRHKDNELFHGLFERLQGVVSANLSTIGPAGATFGNGSVSLTKSPQDKVDHTTSPQDRIDLRPGQEREPAHDAAAVRQERWSGLDGTDRPDIAAAAARMGWVLGGKREITHLHEHLQGGETVRLLAQGTYEKHQGIVALTNQRLLFLFHGLINQGQEDFPLGAITSVQTASGLASGELRVTVGGRRSTISGLIKHDLSPLAAALREAMSVDQRDSTTAALAATPPPVVPPDPYEALAKLAQLRDTGVISEEEFAGKKRELMSRM